MITITAILNQYDELYVVSGERDAKSNGLVLYWHATSCPCILSTSNDMPRRDPSTF